MVDVTLIPEKICQDGQVAEIGSKSAPWIIRLSLAFDVKVIQGLESTLSGGYVARIGLK